MSEEPERAVAVHELTLGQSDFIPFAKGDRHVLFVEEGQGWQKHDLVVVREFDAEAEELTGRHRVARVTWLDKAGARAKKVLAQGMMAASVRIFREPRTI